MVSAFSSITESPACRIVIVQFIATLLVSASCLIVGWMTARSALLGGMVCVIPGIYALLLSTRKRAIAAGGTGLGIILRGEAGKYGLSILLFVLVFTLVQPLDLLVFFGVFGGLQLFNVIVPTVIASRLIRR